MSEWTSRDKILAAVSWWIGLVGLIGLALKNPPLHPAARQHCLFGLVMNVGGFLILQAFGFLARHPDVGPVFACMSLFVWLLLVGVAAANTVAALMERGPFFARPAASGWRTWEGWGS